MYAKHGIMLVAVGALLCQSPAATAQDEDFEEEDLERCIRTNRIQNTHVLDDYRILFYMRGQDVYLNQLPRRCSGLGFEKSFSYRSTSGQLCDLDSITVLRGGRISPGMTCGLGKFRPITEEDADLLRNPDLSGPEAEELPSAEPEEIGEPQ